MDDLSGVEPVDRLTGLVGLVARVGGMLELTAHSLHRTLVGPGRAEVLHRSANSAAVLLEQCMRMAELPGPGWSPAWMEAAKEALKAAQFANDERNAVVHGVWQTGADGRLQNVQQKKKTGLTFRTFTPEQILEIVRLLARADIRLTGLSGLAYRALHVPADAGDLPAFESVERLEELTRGEFDLLGIGQFRLHSDAAPADPAPVQQP